MTDTLIRTPAFDQSQEAFAGVLGQLATRLQAAVQR
jgi:hypothetical protein